MASAKQGGKEITQVVQIDQPFCVKTWGATDLRGQCVAHLGVHGPQKCHNTRQTCPVSQSYSAGESYLLLAGSNAEYAWAPDAAAYDVADLDIIAKVRATDWSPPG